MQTPSQSLPRFHFPASFLRGRKIEDLAYQVGTLGAIVVVLTSILLF